MSPPFGTGIQYCVEQKGVYSQGILAIVLQQQLDVSPLPPLLMRTVIQTVTRYPQLMGFVMGLLSRLITKQVNSMQEGTQSCQALSRHF